MVSDATDPMDALQLDEEPVVVVLAPPFFPIALLNANVTHHVAALATQLPQMPLETHAQKGAFEKQV